MNHLLTPSTATFPVQDKFGNVQMFTGLTKLEYVSALVFAEMNNQQTAEQFDHDFMKIADAAVNRAAYLLNAVQDKIIEMAKEMQEKNSQIIAGK